MERSRHFILGEESFQKEKEKSHCSMFRMIMGMLFIHFLLICLGGTVLMFVHLIGLLKELARGLMNSCTKSRHTIALCESLVVSAELPSGSGRWAPGLTAPLSLDTHTCCQHKH